MAAAFTDEQIRTALADSTVAGLSSTLTALPKGTTFGRGEAATEAFLAWTRALAVALGEQEGADDDRVRYIAESLGDLDPEMVLDAVWHPDGVSFEDAAGCLIVEDAGIVDAEEFEFLRDEWARGEAEDAAFDRARDEGRI